MKDWKKYQEDTARYFRSIGLDARTDVTVKGVRTSHDIDVYVTSHFEGFDVRWIVECKHWRKPVNKLHVLGLREIVADIGADRGVLLSESGFQSGAFEAAQMTNVQLASLAELKVNSSKSIYSMRFRDFSDRVLSCKDRYWNLPKSTRIEYGLRSAYGEHDYSGDNIIRFCSELLSRALTNKYPLRSEDPFTFAMFYKYGDIDSPERVIDIIEPLILEIELKLQHAERH
jgi:restriction system protein